MSLEHLSHASLSQKCANFVRAAEDITYFEEIFGVIEHSLRALDIRAVALESLNQCAAGNTWNCRLSHTYPLALGQCTRWASPKSCLFGIMRLFLPAAGCHRWGRVVWRISLGKLRIRKISMVQWERLACIAKRSGKHGPIHGVATNVTIKLAQIYSLFSASPRRRD